MEGSKNYQVASVVDHYSSTRNKDEKVIMSWANVKFEIVLKDSLKSSFGKTVYKTQRILKGLSGRAESGQLLAILGPTGCGKTSLLNILAARVPSGGQQYQKLSGEVYVNGKIRSEEKFRKISAYVLQDDNLYANLTVYETLMLSAHFYLADSQSDEAKKMIVEASIAELGLNKSKDTLIGNDHIRGVSGGERKRVSIAVQLLTDPAVLFLDEPTSGLDAFQSQAVMESMKNLANNNRLVISVIHQPRSSIFEMFDKILILSEGRTMFYGDAKNSVEYFTNQGFPCPDEFNPADFFLDLLSPDNRSSDSEMETRNRINLLANAWLDNEANKKLTNNHDDNFLSVKTIGGKSSLTTISRNFFLLCWRSWVEQSRNVSVIIAKFVFAIFFALIIGGIYSNIGNDQKSIMNRQGVLYFVLINQCFNSVSAVLNTFPREKTIVNRERSGRAYNTLSYFTAKFIVEMPLNLLPIIIYAIIVHELVGLNKNTFGYFILILMMANVVAITLGLGISAFVPTVEAANAIGPSFLIIGILFGGFYISINSLPIVANWIPYISLFRWAYEALAINEFKGLTFTCNIQPASQCITTGEQVLKNLNFDGHTTSYPVFGLGMLLLAYIAGAYLLLDLNRMKFTPLGFKGRYYSKFNTEESNSKDQQKEQNLYAVVNKDDNNEGDLEMIPSV